MRNLRSHLIIFFVIILLFTLVGCSNEEDKTTKKNTNLNIILIDENTNKVIEDASIVLHKNTAVVSTVKTDQDGKATLSVKQDTEYSLNIIKDNYYNFYGYRLKMQKKVKEIEIELLNYDTKENSFEINTADSKTLKNIGLKNSSITVNNTNVIDRFIENNLNMIELKEAGSDKLNNLLLNREQITGYCLNFSFVKPTTNSNKVQSNEDNINDFSGFISTYLTQNMISDGLNNDSLTKYNILVLLENSQGEGVYRQPAVSMDNDCFYGLIPLIYKGELANNVTIFFTYKKDRDINHSNLSIKSIEDLNTIEVSYDTNLSEINLTQKVTVIRTDNHKMKAPVIWDKDNSSPPYNSKKAGEYIFSAEFDIDHLDNLINSNNIVPSIIVKVNKTKPIFEEIEDQSINENDQLTFIIKANDPDQDTITYSIENLPKGASFDSTTGEFNWTPSYEQAGNYKLTFTADDGQLQTSKKLIITVKDVNRAPIFNDIEKQNVDEGQELSFKLEASDPDKDSITLSADKLPEGANFNSESGEFVWTPGYNQHGSYEVLFIADDQTTSTKKTVNITVNDRNDAPVIQSVTNVEKGQVTVKEGNELILEVTASDADGDRLYYSITSSDIADFIQDQDKRNKFSWKPGFEKAGEYEIIIEVNDGNKFASMTVKIIVEETDQPPVIEEIGDKNVDEGTQLSFKVEAFDPDGDTVTIQASNLPSKAAFNPETSIFSWTPGYQQHGSYEIIFTAEANAQSTEKSVTITVNDKNGQPVINSISNIEDGKASVQEGETLYIDIEASDPDGDSLTYSIEGTDGDKFTNTYNNNKFSWTPSYGDSGDYSIIVNVSDGETTVSQTVNFTLEVTPKPGSITGAISLGSGNVTRDVRIEIKAGSYTTDTTINNGNSSSTYELTGVVPDDYTVKAEVVGNAVGSYEVTDFLQENITVTRASTTENINFNITEFTYDGDGTAANPYKILNWEDLHNIRNNLDKHFILKRDLDRYSDHYYEYASSSANSWKGWLPIGVDYDHSFKGTFDGNGHVISHLYINRKESEFVGLFGWVDGYDNQVEIKDLGLKNINVTGKTVVGGLIGKNKSAIIQNCYVTGDVEAYYLTGSNASDGRKVGGIIGNNWLGTVKNCYTNARVKGFSHVGGLIGIGSDSTLINNYAVGDVDGEQSTGGLVGSNYGTISNSYYDKNTSGQNDNNGTPKTTYEMTYEDTFGWDFTNTWSISEGRTYPWLRWQGRAESHNYPPSFGAISGTIELDGYSVSQDVEVEISADSFTTTIVIPNGSKKKDYVINDLRPGYYNVSAQVMGSAVGTYEIVTSTQTNTKVNEYYTTDNIDFDLELIPDLGSLSGKVGLEEKAVFKDVDIEISAVGEYDQEKQTITIPANNNYKSFSFDNLWPDEYDITAKVIGNAVGYYKVESNLQTVNLNPGEDTQNIEFNLIRFAGGEGTELNPYQISNWYHLYNIRQEPQAYFELTSDLNSYTAGYSENASNTANSNQGWEPIVDFAGDFNGNEHIIKDLYINRSSNNIGLFANLISNVDSDTSVYKLGIEDVNISGSSNVGAIVGINQAGSIESCYSTGKINGYSEVGGLIGSNTNTGTVSNCYSTAKINYMNSQGGYNLGGLIGSNSYEVSNSYAEGTVIGESTDAGGLIGTNSGSVNNCYYNTDTSGQSDTGKGIPRSSVEMSSLSTFSSWDFTNVWDINEEQSYPYFNWQGGVSDYNIIPKPNNITITADSTDIYAGNTTKVTAKVTDLNGNGIEGVWVQFDGGHGSYSHSKLLTNSNGYASTYYTAHENDVDYSPTLIVSENINNNSSNIPLTVIYKPQATVTNIEVYPYRGFHQDYVAATVEFKGVEGDNVFVVASLMGTVLSYSPEEVSYSGQRVLSYLYYNGEAYDLYEGDQITIKVYESFNTMVYPNELGALLASETSDPVPAPPSATITNVEDIKAGDYQVTATVEFSGYISNDNVYLDLYMPHPEGGYFNITEGNPRVVENSGDTVSIDKVWGGAFESQDQVLVVVVDDKNDTYHSALDQKAMNVP